MGSNDMNHLEHLETVALSDCAVLQSKEATYQGSWKRAGGASAWFMARRNLDRLITMMAPKEYPEHVQTPANVIDTVKCLSDVVRVNAPPIGRVPGTVEATMMILDMLKDRYFANDIFAKIAERPGGEDGTVLACLRDARRYFMLVEAEMIAEGVVEPESKTYEQESYVNLDGVVQVDIYQLIADEKGLDRKEVKDRIHALFYGDEVPGLRETVEREWGRLPDKMAAQRSSAGPVSLRLEAMNKGTGTVDTYTFPDVNELKIDADKAGSEVVIRLMHTPPPLTDPAPAVGDLMSGGRPAGVGGSAPRTPEAGSQHSALYPWQMNSDQFARLVERVGLDVSNRFYSRRSADVVQLEPVVHTARLPKELAGCYEYVKLDGVAGYVLRRDRVPLDLDDNFPRLQAEQNKFEWESGDETFKPFYEWDESALKHVLQPRFTAWARQPN